MNFKKTLLASLLMISASGAFAAETATLSVKGTIAPTACNITLGGASQSELTFDVADYSGTQMRLEPQTIPFNIACNPNAFAVSYTVSDDSSSPTSNNGYGLGKNTDGAVIGYYDMHVSDATVDNAPARTINSTSSGAWITSNVVIKSSAGANSFSSSSTPGEVAPVMAKDFSATLKVSPTINAGLLVSEEVELAGAATFTITMI